jgi:hypothetical protein
LTLSFSFPIVRFGRSTFQVAILNCTFILSQAALPAAVYAIKINSG